MQNQNQQSPSQICNRGVHDIVALTIDSPYKGKPSNGLSSIMVSDILTPSSSSIVGDYIGVESCLDLKENEGILTSTSCYKDSDHERFCSQRQLKRNDKWDRKKEFPPPIPSLARTENLSSRMPWVLKRHHTSDGRLILTKEKVMRHEYFLAHRSNGRLILQLVPLDNDSLVPPFVDEEVDEHEIGYMSGEEEEEAAGGEVGVVVEEEGKDMQTTDNVSVESHDDVNDVYDVSDDIEQDTLYKEPRIPSMEAGIGGSGSAGKCYCFNSVRPTSTCMFHIPVPAMRPVHG